MKITKLQQVDPKYWSNFTDSNHLGALHLTQPELISDTIEVLYKINLGSDDIVSLIDRYATHYIDANSDGVYEWLLQGEEEYNIPIVDFSDNPYDVTSKPVRPGLGHSTFWVHFAEPKFKKTDVIVGHKPDLYSLRVMNDYIVVGSNYAYEVQLVTGDENLFIPQEELAAGKRFSSEYGLVEDTLSKEGNGMSFSSPLKMRNMLSMIRKEAVVPGNMINKGKNSPLAWKFKGTDGKIYTRWISKLDWEMLKQFRRDRARLMYGGKSTLKEDGSFSMKGSSGYSIKAGFGLLEQIAPTNIFNYNSFSADYLTDLAMSLSYGKLPEDQRNFKLVTGEYGAIQFHRAIEEKASSIVYARDTNRIQYNGGKMNLGGQFVKYATVNGITFEIVIDSMKDDPIRNKDRNSDGILKSSLEYELLDFGTSEGSPNIQKVAIKGEEEWFAYIPGMRDPFSPGSQSSQPKMIASKVDGYELHRMYQGGIMIKNPMRCARILPA
jgi:hypothetical protein